tara:strand:+ start:44 stop:256 length:213 start_codon:yes stop_codon:yes gene_type:complete
MITFPIGGAILGAGLGYSYGYILSKYNNIWNENSAYRYKNKEYAIFFSIWGIIIGGGTGKLLAYAFNKDY